MDTRSVDRALRATLDDVRLSRAERTALSEHLAELAETSADLDQVQARAFAIAREHTKSADFTSVLRWLEEVVKIVTRRRETHPDMLCEARFSPGFTCGQRIVELLRASRTHVEICVFTITDDRVSREILAAHERGVAVRIITDDAKAWDLGSDITRLHQAGVEVAVDRSTAHMHHKFAIFDGAVVATGSYNWTRSAAEHNQENLVVCDHPPLIRRFRDEFNKLWDEMSAL